MSGRRSARRTSAKCQKIRAPEENPSTAIVFAGNARICVKSLTSKSTRDARARPVSASRRHSRPPRQPTNRSRSLATMRLTAYRSGSRCSVGRPRTAAQSGSLCHTKSPFGNVKRTTPPCASAATPADPFGRSAARHPNPATLPMACPVRALSTTMLVSSVSTINGRVRCASNAFSRAASAYDQAGFAMSV